MTSPAPERLAAARLPAVMTEADAIHLAEMDIVRQRGRLFASCGLAAVVAGVILIVGARNPRVRAPDVAVAPVEPLTVEVREHEIAFEDPAPTLVDAVTAAR